MHAYGTEFVTEMGFVTEMYCLTIMLQPFARVLLQNNSYGGERHKTCVSLRVHVYGFFMSCTLLMKSSALARPCCASALLSARFASYRKEAVV